MVRKILAQLEALAYRWQRKYMRPKMTNELVGPHFAFFHPQDKGQLLLDCFQIRLSRALGKKIVLVTGCFDLLHQEHLRFLKKAKVVGDVLVVGLEPDERIKKMKGEIRPVNSYKIREKNLIRLNEVDFVIKLPDGFGQFPVRFKILRLIKPHFLAISTQDPLEKRKRKECQQINCRLKVVYPYNPAISTSKILGLEKKEGDGKIIDRET